VRGRNDSEQAMNMRGNEFTAATGGGPAGPADAGERNLAPATQSPHPTVSAGPAIGAARPHESARAHVAGSATYVDDVPEVKGTLYAAPMLSNVAHGRLLGIDTEAARRMPGVRGVVLAGDIPGDPMLATFVHDEPVFARDKVEHLGQVVGLVVAFAVLRRAAQVLEQMDLRAPAGADGHIDFIVSGDRETFRSTVDRLGVMLAERSSQ